MCQNLPHIRLLQIPLDHPPIRTRRINKTRYNNEYFLTNRLGQTKFLNVLQGGDWERAEQWYQGVKEFSDSAVWGDKAAEGWAMGGANMSMMDVTLKRLMTLREDGLLKGKN